MITEFVKQLISRLEELYDNHRTSAETYKEAILKNVNQLADEYNNSWIPCSERLPEFDVWVLVTRSSGIIDLDMFKGTRWISREDSVIAWQPLPAPYQPKGD